MKFSEIRLCVDCESIHAEPRCPECGSEVWCYPYNWSNENPLHGLAGRNAEDSVETARRSLS